MHAVRLRGGWNNYFEIYELEYQNRIERIIFRYILATSRCDALRCSFIRHYFTACIGLNGPIQVFSTIQSARRRHLYARSTECNRTLKCNIISQQYMLWDWEVDGTSSGSRWRQHCGIISFEPSCSCITGLVIFNRPYIMQSECRYNLQFIVPANVL
jgi:hypothetical protein